MEKPTDASLEAEIQRYTQQLLRDYQNARSPAAPPAPAARPAPVITRPVPAPAPMSMPAPPRAAPPPILTPIPIPTPVSEPMPESAPMPVPASPPGPSSGPSLTPAQEFAEFAANNPQRGSIKTQALTARSTYPVRNVTVTISKEFESGEYIISTQKTDEAGKTEPVSVPAPDVSLSEEPGQQIPPFSAYKVTFTHPAFATIVSRQLPVFSGTTALQTVNMVPTSASPHGNSTIEYITTEPSDL